MGQAKLARAAGTSPDGTCENGIKAAIVSCGFSFREWYDECAISRWNPTAPIVCCVNRWQHWVTVLAGTGKRVLYFDPAPEEYLRRENNIVSVSRTKFLKRWGAAKTVRGSAPAYYAIEVLP